MDILHSTLCEIKDDVALFHDRDFMTTMFDELYEELPEFKDFLKDIFEDRTSRLIEKSQTKAVPGKMLLNALFEPKDQDNRKCTPILEKVVAIGVDAMIEEMEVFH